jgi:HrpA-like RNA helicase
VVNSKDVVYVIDTCRANQISYDTHKHISRLSQVFVSKANCLQRRGRAGRVREGICYHLVPYENYEKMAGHQIPEIMRVPLEELILQITAVGLGTVRGVIGEALDAPPLRHVERSVEELIKIQALVMGSPTSLQKLTSLGYVSCVVYFRAILVNFPVDVRLGKMILYSVALECLDPCLTIAGLNLC